MSGGGSIGYVSFLDGRRMTRKEFDAWQAEKKESEPMMSTADMEIVIAQILAEICDNEPDPYHYCRNIDGWVEPHDPELNPNYTLYLRGELPREGGPLYHLQMVVQREINGNVRPFEFAKIVRELYLEMISGKKSPQIKNPEKENKPMKNPLSAIAGGFLEDLQQGRINQNIQLEQNKLEQNKMAYLQNLAGLKTLSASKGIQARREKPPQPEPQPAPAPEPYRPGCRDMNLED